MDLATHDYKMTALHWACFDSADERDEDTMLSVVRRLVEEHHADVRLRTSKGTTAADMAMRSERPRIEAYLREKEHDILQRATAASEAACAALLAELDAEEAMAASAAEAAGASTTKKKKNKSKKKNKGGKKQDKQQAEEGGEEQEAQEDGGGGGGVVGRLGGLSIAVTDTTTTTTTTAEAGADDNENEKEDGPSPPIASATTTTTMSDTAPPPAGPATDEQEPTPPPPTLTPPLSLEDFLLQDAPLAYICPISQSLFCHPVVAMDGNSYERSALEEWFTTCARKRQEITSPITGAVMQPGIVPNLNLRSQVLEYIEAKTKEYEEMLQQEEEGGKEG